jgi:YidC/Oxa1 family membrane protein insertase
MLEILFTIIIYPITQIIEFVFVFVQRLFGETGISIAAVSFVFCVLCLPLYNIAEKWQEIERETQKKLAVKIKRIKAVFSGDEQHMILSTYYRQNHYHPLYALRSSLGILTQIPFFIAAYYYLSHSESLRGASFYFIHDLGVPDRILSIGAFDIHILPIIMTVINCASALLYTKGFSAKERIPLFIIPGIFLALLYNAPAGLVFYWILNNIFSLFKNIYFKINFRYKLNILLGIFSAAMLALAVFLLFFHSGNISVRHTIAVIMISAAVVLWCLPFALQQLKKIVPRMWNDAKSAQLFASSVFLLWTLTGLFLPARLVYASPQEFSFIDETRSPLEFILNTALQATGLWLFWTAALYLLFSLKTKKFFALGFAVLAISAFCNSFFFFGNYGLISNTLVFENAPGHSGMEILINFGVLLAVILAVIAIYFFAYKRILVVSIILLCTALSVSSVYSLVEIQKEYKNLASHYIRESPDFSNIKPLFHFSKTGKNVVVVMLDRAPGFFVQEIFKENPNLNEKYSGFVFYPNTVSFHKNTSIGSMPIFGGYDYTPLEVNKRSDELIAVKRSEALLLLPRIFSDAGFSVTVTDPPYANDSWIGDLTIYKDYPEVNAYTTDGMYTKAWMEKNNFKLPSTESLLRRNLLWYAIFRESPLALRRSIYRMGDWCSPVQGQRLIKTLDGYSVLDFLPDLTAYDGGKNLLVLFTNNTTHEVSFMQAPDYIPALPVTNFGTSAFRREMAYHVNCAALKRFGEWLDCLKQNGVYDNTRIILTSDHGPGQNFISSLAFPVNINELNPILLVKDFNAEGMLAIDNSFMTNADAPSLAVSGIIENPKNPWNKNDISMEPKESPLYIAISAPIMSGRAEGSKLFDLDKTKDYYIHDDIFKAENWIKADKYENN